MPAQTNHLTDRANTDEVSDELAAVLGRQLDDANAWATQQFARGLRVSGWSPFIQLAWTFVRSYLFQGQILRGFQGLLASSRAAQHASDRVAMLYWMSLEEE